MFLSKWEEMLGLCKELSTWRATGRTEQWRVQRQEKRKHPDCSPGLWARGESLPPANCRENRNALGGEVGRGCLQRRRAEKPGHSYGGEEIEN